LPAPLHVDTAELRISAARLDAVNGATSAQLTQNAGALAGCQSGWAGTAFAAFEAVRDTWELADAGRADRLGNIAMNFYRSADIYDHRDQVSGEDIEQTT
jgi:WXG100 family type VII secretion target